MSDNPAQPVEYTVAGMTCGGCVNSVTKVVSAALPEARVEVFLDQQRVVVHGAANDAAVQQAVEDAGFDFLGRRQG